MELILGKAAIFSRPLLTLPNCKPIKSPRPAVHCCLASSKNGSDAHGLFKSLEVGGDDEADDAGGGGADISNLESEARSKDIWQLFKEAQQNILYLSKQRIQAVEELNEAKRENQLLLDQIEQLEAEKRAGSFRKDKQSLCWELLLRIDSMVLTGKINTAEASGLRKAVLDHRSSITDLCFDIEQKSDAELLAELRGFSDGSERIGFYLVHICSEMAPLVSVGSLASYVTGLSQALQKKGHLVEVILPKYACLDLTEVQGLREIEAESYSYFNGQLHGNKIWTGVVCGIGVTFVQPLHYSSFFNRERVYGYSDDFERFTYFSRASLDYLVKSGKQPDVLHIHNWETAIVGPLFWDIFVKQGLGGTRVLLTCHGFESQCLEQPDKLALCGLDPSRLHRPDRLQDDTKTHLINVLKGGVVYSNKVLVVSPMHSKGRIIHSYSHGLEPTLITHKDKLLVSPSGFDNSTWDPSKDKLLPGNYSVGDMKGKAICKVALQERLGLPKNASTALVGCSFSELSHFAMDDLKEVVWNTSRQGVQFVFLGSNKPGLSRAMEPLLKQLGNGTVRFISEYDEPLTHLILAGSDIILCQSYEDPLLQMPLKALKYGAAPVAVTSDENRIRPFGDHNMETTKYSQFISSTFGNMSLGEALDEVKNNPSRWRQRIEDAMAKDFSWNGECCDIHVSAYTAIKNL